MKQNRNKTSHACVIRKRFFNAPAHEKYEIMTCKLSKDLQNKQGIKRLPVKRGDTVAIRAGSFAGSAGQVLSVDKKTFRLTVSKVEKSKASGNTFNVPIHYSNCELTRLKPKDLNREKVINKRQARMSAKQVNMEEQAQPAVAA